MLEKQPGYYTFKIVSTLALLAAAIAFLVIVDNFWLRLLDAVFLAMVFGQIGFLGHDAGHQAVTRSPRGNEIIGMAANLLISLSRSWWITQHNQHHTTPNDLSEDPHTRIILMAFSDDQVRNSRGFARSIMGYQAFYFWPLLTLEGFGVRLAGIQFLLQKKNIRYPLLEPVLMALHFVAYFGLIFALMSPWQALAFILVHQLTFGLVFGLAFAPNHKGMLIIDEDNKLDYLRTQVLTTRNVRPSLLADFMYGGLNHQIEHHLFPMMPRNKLGKARLVVQEFCRDRGIAYHETTVRGSFREIASYLHEISAPLRGKPGKLETGTPEYQTQDD